MLKNRFILILFCGVFTASCTSVPMRYQANVVTQDGKKHELDYVYQESYAAHGGFCALTAIAVGGWCWAYFFLPGSDSYRIADEQGRSLIARKLDGQPYSLIESKVTRLDWNQKGEYSQFIEVEAFTGLGEELEEVMEKTVAQRLGVGRWTISLDLGTDNSSHGFGPRLSYFQGAYEFFYAYGASVYQDNLGNPSALGFNYLFSNVYAGMSFSQLKDKGVRHPVYEGGYVDAERDLEWRMNFIHFHVGVMSDILAKDKWFLRAETGLGGVTSVKIEDSESSDYDSNLGEIKGVAVRKGEDGGQTQKVGDGFGGPYIQVGVAYIFH